MRPSFLVQSLILAAALSACRDASTTAAPKATDTSDSLADWRVAVVGDSAIFVSSDYLDLAPAAAELALGGADESYTADVADIDGVPVFHPGEVLSRVGTRKVKIFPNYFYVSRGTAKNTTAAVDRSGIFNAIVEAFSREPDQKRTITLLDPSKAEFEVWKTADSDVLDHIQLRFAYNGDHKYEENDLKAMTSIMATRIKKYSVEINANLFGRSISDRSQAQVKELRRTNLLEVVTFLVNNKDRSFNPSAITITDVPLSEELAFALGGMASAGARITINQGCIEKLGSAAAYWEGFHAGPQKGRVLIKTAGIPLLADDERAKKARGSMLEYFEKVTPVGQWDNEDFRPLLGKANEGSWPVEYMRFKQVHLGHVSLEAMSRQFDALPTKPVRSQSQSVVSSPRGDTFRRSNTETEIFKKPMY